MCILQFGQLGGYIVQSQAFTNFCESLDGCHKEWRRA